MSSPLTCTCDELPMYDMDGSHFDGRCRFCSQPYALRQTAERIRLAAATYGRDWRKHLIGEDQYLGHITDEGPYGRNV